MKPFVARLGLCMLAFTCAAEPQRASGDGGTLRLVHENGGYRITVYTAPAVIRVGAVDISVLVQESETGNPVEAARVNVRIQRRGEPSESISATASHEAATNKLLQAALLTVPSAGWWDVVVEVASPLGAAEARFALEVAEPLPEWRVLWPWFSWPAVAVVLFGAQQFFGRRRSN